MLTLPRFWFEIIVMIIVPLPMRDEDSFFGLKVIEIPNVNWFDDGANATGSLVLSVPYLTNDFLLALMFFRFYFILQATLALSPPNNRLFGKRVCHENGVEHSFSFQLRTAFREHPYVVFLIFTLFLVIALVVHFERKSEHID